MAASLPAAPPPEAPSPPSTILFISTTSNSGRAMLMLDAFLARWREREAEVRAFHHPLSAYSFPPSAKGYGLARDYLAERLGSGPPKLIVAQGDPAASLAVSLRGARFPESAIIAFDVTGGARELYKDEASMYFIENSTFGEKNIEFAKSLFPKRKRAVLLISTGPDLSAVASLDEEMSGRFPELDFEIVPNPTPAAADTVLLSSPEDSFIISFSPGWVDRRGRNLTGKDYVRSLVEYYGAPVLDYIREDLDGGTVGGVGVSAERWGGKAADMGLALVLDAKEPERWASAESLMGTFADYRELLRFGSSMSLVPAGTEIVNRPPPAWVRFQVAIQLAVFALLLALCALIVHFLDKGRERRLLVDANATLEGEVAQRTHELRDSNRELAASNENLVAAMRRTEEMQEKVLRSAREITLGRLTAGIANGLNSPLNAVRSASAALRAVASDVDGLLALDEGQRALFARFAPRVAARSDFSDEAAAPSPADLERRLARLSCADGASLAADLADSGLAGLGDADLQDFAAERGRPVARALYRLSVVERSAWIIDEAVDRAIEAVRAVREYVADSQSEPGAGKAELRATIERALLLFKNRLPKSVVVRTDLAEVPPAPGSEARFVRIWVHLIQNALQAMPNGGALGITLRQEEGFALVDVEDEGEGIAPSVADSLFEPFVTTKPLAEGMGLGLAYCKRTIESMGGSIGCSGKGAGTVFSVRVPLEPPQSEARDEGP